MITTYQMMSWVAPYLTARDPATMPMDQRQALVAAFNAALQVAYSELPTFFRRTKASTTLQAPRQLTIGCTQYSNVIAGPFTDDERGCTVRVAGEKQDNTITSPASLLANILGVTGSKAATVWHDVLPIDQSIVKVLSDPQLDTGCVLYRVEYKEVHHPRLKHTGEPKMWWMEPVGLTQGGEPMGFIRVYPMPTQDYNVEVELELAPMRIMLSHLNNPVALPIQDSIAESILLPLIQIELSRSPFFIKDASTASITSRAETAIKQIRDKIPRNIVRNVGTMRVPRQW